MSHFHTARTTYGTPVIVEYDVVSYGSPTTYSPLYGADGGDSPEIEVIDVVQRDSDKGVWLSDRDRARIELEILDAHDWSAYADDDFYDPDDWR